METAVRPNLQMVHSIIDRMLNESLTLKAAVEAHGITMGQFKRYVYQEDKEARAALASAWDFQAHILVDEALHIADTSSDSSKARNQIDIRKWKAERLNRRAYGQQIDISVTQTLDITSSLAEAKARILQPVRDQLTHDPSQVVDVAVKVPQSVSSAPEQAPPASAPPGEPDIFS